MAPRTDPTLDWATAYAAERTDGALALVPVAHVGPGRTARIAFALGVVLGLAFLGGYVAVGLHFQNRIARNPVGQPAWLPWLCPGGILLPIGLLAVAGCVKLARGFHRPLVAERNGPVRHGPRLLVAEGNIAGVRVERMSEWVCPESGPNYERKTAHVYIATTDGRFEELPPPYFSNLDGWELAESLGAALAAALGVALSFEAPPPEHSTPATNARRWSYVFGSFALFIGGAHWLAGFGLLAVRVVALVNAAVRVPADMPPPWFAAIFVCSGAGACYIGCRLFGHGRRRWLAVLAVLATLESAVLLAIL
jgi:hypothetical protein